MHFQVFDFFKEKIHVQYPLRTGQADLIASQRTAHEVIAHIYVYFILIYKRNSSVSLDGYLILLHTDK